jgi:hypothetical protein
MRHRRVRGATPIAPRTYFEGTAIGGLSVNSLTVKILLQKLAITVTVRQPAVLSAASNI